MKLSPRRIALALLAIVAAVAIAAQLGRSEPISYSPRLDALCSIVRGPPIKEEWKVELTSRLDEYRRLWSDVGPPLLAEAEAITGIAVPAAKTVHLTLCNVPSQSIFGISVNMRFALKTHSPTPVPLRYKVDTQFHELLHDMLAGHIARGSQLLAAHPREPDCVKNHLHLLALQKAVLLRLNETDALADVMRIDSSLPGGCYRRAWELVNASESGYLSYLSEIRR